MMKSSRPALMMAVRCRQAGAASVAIAILIMLILVAAVLTVQNMSGSSAVDSAKSEEQVAALFLAESGVERTQAMVGAKAAAGTLTDADCTGLVGFSLGRGNVVYSSPQPTPDTCGGATPCVSCAVTVTGNILNASGTVTASRAVRATISTTPTEGIEGCGSDFTIPMPILAPGNSVVFSHVAYRAQDSDVGCSKEAPVYNSNARVGNCIVNPNVGGSCNLVSATPATTNYWDIQGTGNKAISSMGVAGTATTQGSYTIQTKLEKDAGTRGLQDAIRRDYAQAAVVFYPPSTTSPAVAFMGSYESNTTSQTSGLTGSVDEKWTCQRASATSSNSTPMLEMWRAGVSDALVYGYSGWLANTSSTATLDKVTLGIQPLREISSTTGTQTLPVYSNIWMTYNKGYYPSTETSQSSNASTVPGATNGANFTGTIGATFTGTIASGILTLNSSLGANQLLAQGDTLFTSAAPTVSIGVLGTKTSAAFGWGASGSTYNIIGATATSSTTMVAKSNNLHVIGASIVGGALKTGDSITNASNPPTVIYGSLGASVACSNTVGPGPAANCTGNTVYAFTGTATQTSSALYSAGGSKAITVPSSPLTPVTAPAGGTAVAIPSGTGRFSSTSFTGTVSGTALEVTSGFVTLCAGDALFSGGLKEALPSVLVSGIKSGTTVVLTAGTCSSGTSFTLSQPVGAPITSATPMVARTAVIPKSFTGTISGTGTVLTVSTLTTGSDKVAVGDVLSCVGCPSGLKVSTLGSGVGGSGTYNLTGGTADVALTSFTATNPKSFTVSRDPLINLSGGSTVVCGGVCAMLFPATGVPPTSAITFTLSGIPSGNDWSSGFACLQGVDAFNIQTLGKKVAKRGSWAEIIR